MFRVSRCVLGLVVITLIPAASSLAEVVYDNTTTPCDGNWTPNTELGFWAFSEYAPYEPMGDEVTLLAGGARLVTEFHLVLRSSQETILSHLKVFFYKNDGNGTDDLGMTGHPGTKIWEDEANDIPVNGATMVGFTLPYVEVPDTFIWIAMADSNVAGLATYDPPTVGSSDNFFWDRDSMDGRWYQLWFESDPVASFGARIVAVPEPASIFLLVLGGACVAARRRRSRRCLARANPTKRDGNAGRASCRS